MYNRIVKELSWPEIRVKYTSFFDSRSEDGLTSVITAYVIVGIWEMC
jgi:hypothetical protein